MFFNNNKRARPNLRSEASELHKLIKEHKKFHRKAFSILMKCHKADDIVGKQPLRKKLYKLNREIISYNNSFYILLKTECIDFDKVLIY